MTSTDVGERGIRPVTTAMRSLLLLALILALLAGVRFFVLAGRTSQIFVWSIGFPLNEALLGAGYSAICILLFIVIREKVWVHVRPAVPGPLIATTLIAIASIIHFGVFNLENVFDVAWLTVYFIVPIALGIILAMQRRNPGTNPPRRRHLPAWLRGVLAIQGLALILLSVGLFVAPTTVDALWPWGLPPLLARVFASFLIGSSVLWLQVVWENDWRRVRPIFLTALVYGLLLFIAVGRYRDAVTWDGHLGAILFVITSFVLVGLYGTFVGWFVIETSGRPTSDPR